MKQITNKEYEEWQKYKAEKAKGHVLLPDTVRFICEANGYDAEKIHACGIDISEKMIDVARQKYPRITFKAQPCYPLQFEDESIDVITVCCAFHHFENPQNFIDECKRVLKKNGRVYIADPNYSPLVRFLANTIMFRLTKKGDVKVYSEEELKEFFTKARFIKVESYKKGLGIFLTATK